MVSFFDIKGVVLTLIILIVLSVLLGRYIAKIFNYQKTWLDFIFDPLDRLILKLSGIQPSVEMNWKQILYALLSINATWFLLSMIVLTNMAWLPLNPDHNPSMSASLAFHTAISFVTNTNLQDYVPEQQVSYLGQMLLMLWQFISAASGLAICASVFKYIKEGSVQKTGGNFYDYFVRVSTRLLLPLCIIVAVILLYNGSPMTFLGKASQTTLEGGTTQMISRGPVAAFVAIKQIGTNGGGFFNANSAHPFENPNYFTNMVEMISILLIPMSIIFAFGFALKKVKLSVIFFGIMFILLLVGLIFSIYNENKPIPSINQLPVFKGGNMEGKETRIGLSASANWLMYTTSTSSGSTNSMVESMLPLTGMLAMFNMMVNCIFGGVGVGFLNFFVFVIIGVFMAGLMVGRTPELMGKKVEAKEMKIAMVTVLIHPLLILAFTSLACYIYVTDGGQSNLGWLHNFGFHGFSEMLYQYTSASANNGSNFAGLSTDNNFWNITGGIVMLLNRYIPIIGPLAIVGSLGGKKYIAPTAGTLKPDSMTFAFMVFIVIIIITALGFFPALSLGPIAEHFVYFG